MEDENKKQGEDENLNSEGTEGAQVTEQKKSFTLEEVEAMKRDLQSNSDKGVQKILAEKKISDRAFDEIKLISSDANRLIELAESDDKDDKATAKHILEKYGFDSIDSYKTKIGYEEDYTDPQVIQKKIREEAKALADSDKIQTKKDEFIEKLKMTDDEKKSFEESFEELKGLKSFNGKELEKQFEKAYRLANEDSHATKKLQEAEIIGKAMTIGDGSGRGDSKTTPVNPFNAIFEKYKPNNS